MINSISTSSLANLSSAAPLAPIKPDGPAGGSFTDFLLDSVERVNQMQLEADRSVESLMTGGDVNPAEVLTAVQKADLAFRMMMQMRNKLLEVYQQVQDVRI
jgi:flagellar hook-basal body complex protein FliE